MVWSSLAGPLLQAGLPALGGLLGGPLGSTVGSVVGTAIAKTLGVPPTPQAVAQKIEADPSGSAVALAQIEAETKAREAELADIASARNQTIQLAHAGSPIAWGAPVVSLIVTVGFFGIMAGLFFVRSEMPQSVFQLLSVMLGILATAFASVVQYWTGSSESSRRNGDTVRALAQQVVTPSPTQVARDAIAVAKRR